VTRRRRQTRRWFVAYTVILVAVVVFSIAKQQWSVAGTALAIAILFGLFTRRLWRKR
jgi:hypothetical protein